jgi:tripartite-type tricarboxylate transporter receptor subunit TctC
MRLLLCIVTAIATSLLPAPTQAQPASEFYRGKTLRLLIGYGPGGGTDLYARLVAEFLPRFIPGNPLIVPQNMPGGGSFVAAKFLHEAAPRDGTVLGSLSQTLALDSLINTSAKIDVTQLKYLGRTVTSIDVGVSLPETGIRSFEDARTKEYVVGASGGGSTTVLYPTALNAYAGAKFRVVRGYKGTNDIILAMNRREVDIVGAYGLPGMLVSHPGWVYKKEANIVYAAALKRHRLLPHVPTMPELAQSAEGEAVLHAVSSTGEFGRSILTTPGVPEDRLAELRKAFAAMLADETFLATAEKRGMTIDPGTGEELDAITQQTLKLPSEVVAKIAKMME